MPPCRLLHTLSVSGEYAVSIFRVLLADIFLDYRQDWCRKPLRNVGTYMSICTVHLTGNHLIINISTSVLCVTAENSNVLLYEYQRLRFPQEFNRLEAI
jgi:hypothetical protein